MAAYSPPGTAHRTQGDTQRAPVARGALDRILEMMRERPTDPYGEAEPVHGCARCADTGLAEYTTGTFTTPGGQHVEASARRPVYRRCPVCAGVYQGVRA